MAIYVLFFIIFFGIFLAISVYLYENSQYSKQTGFPFLMLLADSEIRFQYRVSQKLKKTTGQYKVLFNIILPQGERKIDVLLIHSSGLHVMAAKKMGGWIYGRERDFQWAQVLERGQMRKFQNPVIENRLEMMNLQSSLPGVNEEFFHSLIVFDESCSFKNIELHSANAEVIKINELPVYLERFADVMEETLTIEEITNITSKLEPFANKQINKETMFNATSI